MQCIVTYATGMYS